jgi:hypothetical protein
MMTDQLTCVIPEERLAKAWRWPDGPTCAQT